MFKFPSSLKLALLLAAAPVISLNAATTIIDWGSESYVGASTPLNLGSSSSSNGTTTWGWNDTTPISPAGPKVYGAFRLSNSTGTGEPSFAYATLAPGTSPAKNNIRIAATAESGTLTMRGLVYFKKEDFLVSGGPFRFDTDSNISITTTSSIGTTRQNRLAVYALVGEEWNWYLAQTTFGGTSTFSYEPADMKWAIYTPNGSEFLPTAPTTSSLFSTLGSSFEDIGAVGIFINYAQTTAGSNATIHFSNFSVTAIPEPSGVAMAALGMAGILGFRFYKATR